MGLEIEYVKEIAPEISLSDLVAEYCSNVNNTIFILLGLVFIMWLLEPAYSKMLDKIKYKNDVMKHLFTKSSLLMLYKWIGLGFLFMAGYMIWMI